MNTLAQDIFVQAHELEPASREAFLVQACGDNTELHLEVQRLLVDAERANSFFGGTNGATFGAQEFQNTCAEKEGDPIGPYKLRQAIGEGGFGTVWMAEQSVPISRMVALKVIKAGMDTKQVLARFEAERQALAMMDHPHIAKVLDAGATPTGRPWFAMELVKGIPITDYCDQAGLGTKERLALFGDVCSAINHAHQKGIIHRDIKPSNVMVTLHGDKAVAKVIDFGIAKATQGKLTDRTLFTRFEQFIGTPVYMSPEQASLSGLDIDTRSDIYALGILLYELLVGKPPFDAKSLVSAGYEEMRRIIREVEPVKPSSRIGTIIGEERTLLAKSRHVDEARLGHLVEPDLDWIVMKAIEKDRTRRYETANAFAQDIVRFLTDEPVIAGPPGVGYKMRKFVRRNRTTVAVAGTILLLLVAGVFGTSWFAVLSQEAKQEAVGRGEETKAALKEAEVALKESRHEEAKAWLERARLHASQGNDFAAAMMAAKGLGFRGFGAERQSAEFGKTHPVLLDRGLPETEQLMQIAMGVSGSSRPIWQAPISSDHDEDAENYESLAFSPDGATLAGNGANGTIRLFSVTTGKELRSLLGHSKPVSSLAFSPDGEILASGGLDDTIKFWDPTSGKETGSAACAVDCLAFSPNGMILATSNRRGATRLWDVSTRKEIRSFGEGGSFMAFSPDGGTLAVGERSSITLWDLFSGREIHTLELRWDDRARAHVGVATEKEIQSLGREIASSIRTIGGLAFTSVAFSPDGTTLAAGTYVNIIMLWDVPTRKMTRFLQGHQTPVYSVAFSPDGAMLASGAMDETIKLWEVTTGREIQSLWGRQQPVSNGDFTPLGGGFSAAGCLVFSPDGVTLASGSRDETIKLWNVPAGRKPRSLEGDQGWVAYVNYSPDGATLASASGEGIKLWDVSTGKDVQFLARHLASPWCVTFTPDGAIVASRDDDNTIKLRNAATGKEIRSIQGHHAPVSEMVFNPDGSILASIACGETVKLWKVSTGEEIRSLGGATEGPTGMAFSLDGTRISTSTGETITLWDVSTGKEIWSRPGNPEAVMGAVFSPDGATLATVAMDEIRIWDLSTGEVLRSFKGHRDHMTCGSFSPNGRILATGSYDETIKLWDVSTGREIQSLRGDQGEINSVAFSPDGTTLASGNSDGTVSLWSTSYVPLDLAGYLDPRKPWCRLEGSQIVWTTRPLEPSTDLEFEFINVLPSSHVAILRSTASGEEKNHELFWDYLQAENWNSARVMSGRLVDPALRETAREMTVRKRATKAQSAFDRGLYHHARWHLNEITSLWKSEETDPAMLTAKESIGHLKAELDKLPQ